MFDVSVLCVLLLAAYFNLRIIIYVRKFWLLEVSKDSWVGFLLKLSRPFVIGTVVCDPH